MRRIVNSLRFIIVAITLFVTAVSAYAQKPGVRGVDENMLRYRYIEKDERKINFSKSLNFSERSYIFVGTGVEGLYQLGYHPESPGYAIGSRLGIGYWATPLHGVEMSLSYGMMPFGYWSENFFGNPVIDNTIIRNMGFEANYVLNVTNHVNRHDKVNTLDFIYAAGVNVGAGDMFNYGVNTSLKAVLNLGSRAGLYVEPKVNFMNFEYVRPSVTAGFVYRIQSHDSGFDRPVDSNKKETLLALKSNALFWLLGAPNFGLEYAFDDRWSLCADYVAPWSSSFATGLYYQLLMANVEGRYWFGNREQRPVMTGLFAGASVGGGYYDFMFGNTKTGIQGEFYILAGASVGYAHSISSNDRVRLEYALGLGYLQTRYRKYHYDDFDYVLDAPREQIWKTSIFGPTQAKVSLVYLLFKNKKEVKNE